jgi:hypothetical protein
MWEDVLPYSPQLGAGVNVAEPSPAHPVSMLCHMVCSGRVPDLFVSTYQDYVTEVVFRKGGTTQQKTGYVPQRG